MKVADRRDASMSFTDVSSWCSKGSKGRADLRRANPPWQESGWREAVVDER